MFDRQTRRTFLQAVVAVAASTTFGCSDDKPSADGSSYFPQSVASGDPRPDSVVLWVRAVDPDNASANAPVRLEVATTAEFTSLVLDRSFTALAEHDHALKVKVTNLSPRTTYYYRFTLEVGGTKYTSATGRTRTAPAAGDDVAVRFAFASCQDYIGRYYNAWQRLLQLDEDLDFVVFLGDYVYETTGDTSFQSANGQRTVVFSEPEKALRQGTGLAAFYAANSLSNYRDLYKAVRSDKLIQQVHERYPFIVTWDDHEFSDDAWGANATYLDGRAPEEQLERKQNAERAFFEFIPLDNTGAGEGAIDVGAAPVFPNTRIYRDFEFGKNLKLMVADYRTYRPDHLIPEDAYPGSVVLAQEVLAVVGALPLFQSATFAYVDIDAAEHAAQKAALQGAYVQGAMAAGLTQAEATEKVAVWVKGPQALFYVNQVLDAVNKARVAAGAQPIPKFDPNGAKRGVAYAHMGKSSLFNIQGSRYIVVKPLFDLYAQIRYGATQGASENALGTEQQTWLQTQLQATNTWKIVVSSVSLSSMVFDLSQKTDIPDETLRQAFYFSVDQWDGFPTKKKELLGYIRSNNIKNAMFISGDIHASFASVESHDATVPGGVPTLTAPAITSGSIKELAGMALLGAGYAQGSAVYKYIVAQLNESLMAANPGMRYANGDAHGFVVVELKGAQAQASFHLIPSTEVAKDYSKRDGEELASKFTRVDFRIANEDITRL
ncbi:alkaline phosphatase D family protein [Myxococcus sp. K15C18031901]|uniref:alkaline phosphatase D family protein n=1 Tax=Myxococcus dinghuensis TaxID=2906761 RepID=UPI0020A83134|nr:alkaline phosphatase D family protein [Myxococcus dinghuensis]MCP3102000.1 alkaline phosphatase D family protein [Myxococcus dinghuensis]